MKKLQLVKLTICGPSDVSKEVEIVKKVIEDWNRLNAETRCLTIKQHHWKTDTYPDASELGQNAINAQIIDESEILVAIFWSRIGTPTPVAPSGTVEEIRRGIAQKRKVLVYFSDLEPLPANADKRQIERLWQFRQELTTTSSCWTFQSRSKFREDFITHLALALNALYPEAKMKPPGKKAPKVRQSIKGSGNVQIAGDGNQVKHYQRPPVIKNVIERRPGSVTPEEEHQITAWINDLAEGTLGKARGNAYAEWGSRFLKHFRVVKRGALASEKMGEVEAWYRQQRAMQKSGYKSKAPDQWRNSRIGAIKAAMKDMEKEKESYYEELSDRLNMKRPFTSLTKVTKTDLERIYIMVLRDARAR